MCITNLIPLHHQLLLPKPDKSARGGQAGKIKSDQKFEVTLAGSGITKSLLSVLLNKIDPPKADNNFRHFSSL
jgi:hypothetical protein